MKKTLFILSIVFCLTTNAQYTKLHDFSGAPYASRPYGSLYYDGTFLYGMTSVGGANNLGAIFKIMPNGTGYTTLLDFHATSYTNGAYPQGSLISDGTFLYGMTSRGGAGGGACRDRT